MWLQMKPLANEIAKFGIVTIEISSLKVMHKHLLDYPTYKNMHKFMKLQNFLQTISFWGR